MLRLLETPEGTPVGKPFVLSIVISHEQLANGELLNIAAKEAESAITKYSVPANAVVLGHYFPQVNAFGAGVYMAVQPYDID
jgi:hypothetical protein